MAAVTGLAFLAGCGGGGTSMKPHAPAGLAGLPATKILSEAATAAKAAGWVTVGLSGGPGAATYSVGGVIGPSAGRATIQIAGAGQAAIIVIGRLGYVRGSAAFLHGILDLPAPDARLAGSWIVFQPGEPGYQQVVTGMTLTSFLSEVMPNGSPLPVVDVQYASNAQITVFFSRWGRAATVTKPRHSLPAPARSVPGSA